MRIFKRNVMLTREQAKSLIDAADPELKLRLVLALGYGLYFGEITNINTDDADFLNNAIRIYRMKKKSVSQSIIPVPVEIMSMIKALPAGKGKRAGFVFPHRHCENSFKNALVKAGIDPKALRVHDLRRSAASWELETGTNLETIRKFLGHSHIDTTARYLNAEDKEIQVAINQNPKFLI